MTFRHIYHVFRLPEVPILSGPLYMTVVFCELAMYTVGADTVVAGLTSSCSGGCIGIVAVGSAACPC